MAWRNLRSDIAEEFGGYAEHELNTEFVKQSWANRIDRQRQRVRAWHELMKFRRKVDPAYREVCRARWRVNNRAHYWRHRAKRRAAFDAWYRANREAKCAYGRAYYQANRESYRDKNRAWYAANREDYNARRRTAHAAKPKPPRLCGGCGHAAPGRKGTPPRFCSDICRRRGPQLERESALYALLEEVRRG